MAGRRIALMRTIAAVALAALWTAGCEDMVAADEGVGATGDTEQDEERIEVVVQGETFRLRPALDNATREKGLGNVRELGPHDGMIFVFPRPALLYFVMRDCYVDIDVAFLDDAGRVVAIHEMKVEDPRGEGESAAAYEARLTKYSSRYPARFAVEVPGGTLERLGLKTTDLVAFDVEGLKRRAE